MTFLSIRWLLEASNKKEEYQSGFLITSIAIYRD
jgi:hypothetical protein